MPKKADIPAYERMRRIALAVSPRLDRTLRVLGLDPEPDPDSGRPAPGATEVTAALGRYAALIDRAAAELEKMLCREEWNYLADVLNGCADMHGWSDSPVAAVTLIRAEAEDAHSLDRTGDKWFGEELEPGSGDKAARALFSKLAKLTPIQGEAIMAAVRWFWSHCRAVDHAEHPWWTVEYRAARSSSPEPR